MLTFVTFVGICSHDGRNDLIKICLGYLRAKKIFLRKAKMGHTSDSAIKASSKTLLDLAKEARGKYCNLANLRGQSSQRHNIMI